LEKRGVEVMLEIVASDQLTRVTEVGQGPGAHPRVGAGLQAHPIAKDSVFLSSGARYRRLPSACCIRVFAIGDIAWITDAR
jgi:hypothetical protein